MSRSQISAVDVFCGAAGLSLGLKSAGIDIAAGIDLDPDCQFPFEENIGAPFLERDVTSLPASSVAQMFHPGALRLLAGCAPCQPFSAYTTKRHGTDARWQLLFEFMRLVEGVGPDLVTLENVPRLVHTELWSRFVSALKLAGYHVSWGILDASSYGVPQARRRLVLLASRLGPIQLPKPHIGPRPTVRSAIGVLPSILAGDQSKTDRLHSARALTVKNLDRIRRSSPAGTWRDWPLELRVDCHVKGASRYPSVYGRMSWDKPSPTITTQFYGFGNGRFGHPEQDRAITLREGAVLQSFPTDYKFLAPSERLSFNRVGKMIGNAVPPALAQAIGKTIREHAN